MHKYTIVCYKQYGSWSSTMPFQTRRAAEEHVARHLDRPDKDYVTDITYIEAELKKGNHR